MPRVSHSHSYGESALHLQFTPKYRREVFSDPVIMKVTRGLFFIICRELHIEPVAAEGGPDHMHFFIRNWKNHSIPALANRLKGRVAWELRRRFPENLKPFKLGKSFWSDGYFYETVGSVTAEARQFYIERCQGKHWDAQPPEISQSQKTLLSFAN